MVSSLVICQTLATAPLNSGNTECVGASFSEGKESKRKDENKREEQEEWSENRGREPDLAWVGLLTPPYLVNTPIKLTTKGMFV